VLAALLQAAWPASGSAATETGMPTAGAPLRDPPIDQAPAFSRAFYPPPPRTSPESTGPVPATLQSATSPPSLDLDAVNAESAWRYFELARVRATCLFDSVLGYHHATMWDIGSGLAGLVCAEQLRLISRAQLGGWLEQQLASLARMPLFDNVLPNREYAIATLAMHGPAVSQSVRGNGWSTTDMGRLLIWLKITANWYPEFAATIRDLVGRWALARMAIDGQAFGGYLKGGRGAVRQEGRLGYEQYAATGLALWGLDMHRALRFESVERFELLGVPLLRDTRNLAALTSEPFFLARMELGSVSPAFDLLGQALFQVQEKHAALKGTLIAVSEDAIDRQPWFLYNSVCFEHRPWACVNPAGVAYPELACVSTKAAVAWWALYDTPYAARVLDAVKNAFDPQRGYWAGVYNSGAMNRSLNVNTNAVILESLLYRRLGRQPFLTASAAASRRSE
jgi:hypothetical protein